VTANSDAASHSFAFSSWDDQRWSIEQSLIGTPALFDCLFTMGFDFTVAFFASTPEPRHPAQQGVNFSKEMMHLSVAWGHRIVTLEAKRRVLQELGPQVAVLGVVT
jgi:hypothetical protein